MSQVRNYIIYTTAILFVVFADSSEPVIFVVPHGDSFVWDDIEAKAMEDEVSYFESFDSAGIGFNIMYSDDGVGFTDSLNGPLARDTFRQALTYAAETLEFRNRVIDIFVFPSRTGGRGFLAAAGTGFPLRPGIHPGGFVHRLITGEKLDRNVPEMVLTVDFGFPWAFAEESPDPEKYDLFATLLHEVVHALGFSSRISTSGTSLDATGAYSVYDTFLVDSRDGTPLISRNPLIPFFADSVDTLTAGVVGFRGRHAVESFGGGQPVPISAGAPFRQGSSLSHWEFGIHPDGVLMDPGSGPGEYMREFSDVDHGAIQDIIEEARATERANTLGCTALTTSAPPPFGYFRRLGRADFHSRRVVAVSTSILFHQYNNSKTPGQRRMRTGKLGKLSVTPVGTGTRVGAENACRPGRD